MHIFQQPKVPLFTVVRQPGEQDSHDGLHNTSPEDENIESATLQVQDYNGEPTDNEQNDSCRNTTARSVVTRSNDGRSSQITSIDDSRLRRLLEELYKDKKYFDQYVDSKGIVTPRIIIVTTYNVTLPYFICCLFCGVKDAPSSQVM